MKAPLLGKARWLADDAFPAAGDAQQLNERARRLLPTDNPLYTGRYFLVLRNGVADFRDIHRVLTTVAGLSTVRYRDVALQALPTGQLPEADVLLYDHLRLALVSGEPQQLRLLEAQQAAYALVPEKVVYVPRILSSVAAATASWGLNVTRVPVAGLSGKGVRLAVLDTGCMLAHPDFLGRHITAQSFVPGETAEDGHGHGTHCIGTACGHTDAAGLRYGIAYESEIYAGKVLNNEGSGAQQYILDGITWAADQGCRVISLSLGSQVLPGSTYDVVYERAAQYANSRGAIVVAAAGNDSARSMGVYAPVSSPANCPSVLAVAAVDAELAIADFSNRALNEGAQVDIAGPGVDIYSAWPAPLLHRRISGTSMATPHVAGILALFWQKYPAYTYQQVAAEMLTFTQKLSLPATDAGSGLVTAPSA